MAKSKANTNHLTDEESKLFYKLWMSLLNYVNRKYKIDPELGRLETPANLDIKRLIPIREKLWENVSVIDEYVQTDNNLAEGEKEILLSWKQAVYGEFILLKHVKNYSVFLTSERYPLSFAVTGIISTFDELFPKDRLPTTMRLCRGAGKLSMTAFCSAAILNLSATINVTLTNSITVQKTGTAA